MCNKPKVPEGSWISIFRLVLEPGNLYCLHNYVPSTKDSPCDDRSIANEYLLTGCDDTFIIHQLAYTASILHTVLTTNFLDINKRLQVRLALANVDK